DRLMQILFNLVGNAIKFTNKGSIEFMVRVADRPKQKTLKFIVKDSGIGLKPEQIKNLFIPFVQIKSNGTSGEPGSGLGLSISQELAKAMGGFIKLKSEFTKGSTFWLEIPLKAASVEKSIPRIKSENKVMNIQ